MSSHSNTNTRLQTDLSDQQISSQTEIPPPRRTTVRFAENLEQVAPNDQLQYGDINAHFEGGFGPASQPLNEPFCAERTRIRNRPNIPSTYTDVTEPSLRLDGGLTPQSHLRLVEAEEALSRVEAENLALQHRLRQQTQNPDAAQTLRYGSGTVGPTAGDTTVLRHNGAPMIPLSVAPRGSDITSVDELQRRENVNKAATVAANRLNLVNSELTLGNNLINREQNMLNAFNHVPLHLTPSVLSNQPEFRLPPDLESVEQTLQARLPWENGFDPTQRLVGVLQQDRNPYMDRTSTPNIDQTQQYLNNPQVVNQTLPNMIFNSVAQRFEPKSGPDGVPTGSAPYYARPPPAGVPTGFASFPSYAHPPPAGVPTGSIPSYAQPPPAAAGTRLASDSPFYNGTQPISEIAAAADELRKVAVAYQKMSQVRDLDKPLPGARNITCSKYKSTMNVDHWFESFELYLGAIGCRTMSDAITHLYFMMDEHNEGFVNTLRPETKSNYINFKEAILQRYRDHRYPGDKIRSAMEIKQTADETVHAFYERFEEAASLVSPDEDVNSNQYHIAYFESNLRPRIYSKYRDSTSGRNIATLEEAKLIAVECEQLLNSDSFF